MLDRLGRVTRFLLDQTHHAVPFAFRLVELVVGEHAPRLLDPAAHLVPRAFELELPAVIHVDPPRHDDHQAPTRPWRLVTGSAETEPDVRGPGAEVIAVAR